jgi:hypothetical protein
MSDVWTPFGRQEAQRSILACAALVAVAAGCTYKGNEPTTAPRAKRVVVARSSIVGFFPAVTEQQLETDAGIASALEHWEWALENAQGCFGPKGIHVQAVVADAIRIESDGRAIEIAPRLGTAPDIGYYLITPGRAPALVKPRAGPSSLLHLLPEAAAAYFAVPECAPEGPPP